MYAKLSSLFFIGFFVAITSYSQEKCGMDKYQLLLEQKNLMKESSDQFEEWLANKIFERRSDPKLSRTKEVITIPVVVHIVHNGEPIGVGRNISDDQVLSQIEVLNEDFRRLNADASNTPTVFLPVASDIEIQFALAQQDPEGLPTNGIVRVNGNREDWFLVDNYDLKSQSNWPSEDYMNIWVAELGDNFLGYAQFPVSNIGGLETASNNGLTDGIVVHYRAFGSVAKYAPADLFPEYNLGRTATHEVGHYMGLRHIWGDGGCGTDDFCTDTPASSSDNGGVTSCNFPGPNRCGSDDMFQNYMDFTDDICMNLFTEDQKTRIRTVLDNSPRRTSLKNSIGAQAPVMVNNDLGIRSILSPQTAACNVSLSPALEIRNYGNNDITSAEIEVLVNGISQQTVSLSISLSPLDITTADLSAITLESDISNEVQFQIIQVNGTSDGNSDNNEESIQVEVAEELNGSIDLNFDEVPASWTIDNPDDLFTWEQRFAPNGEVNNRALFIEMSSYENEGDFDFFTSPILDFSEGVGSLTFDVAYVKYVGFPAPVEGEGLMIIVSENCEDPLTDGEVVYYKLAEELKTAGDQSSFFVPNGPDDWRTETVDLSAYLGSEDVRISFVSRNGWGNNLYIDNINLLTLPLPGVDLEDLVSPSVSSSNSSPNLLAQIRNSGAVPLQEFTVKYVLDDLDTVTTNVQTSLPLGEIYEFDTTLPELALGSHRPFIGVSQPNDTTDFSTVNNSRVLYFNVDDTSEVLPLKESFSSSESTWNFANPDNDVTWVVNDGLASIDLSIYEELGEEDWLVSPVISLEGLNTATLNFDHSYSYRALRNDGLRVVISANGGESYDDEVFNRFGEDLLSGTFTNPRTEREFQNNSVSLDSYLGESNIRIGFVSNNDNGDPIYIDNIQIFVTDPFITAENDLFPNPTVNGQFNLRFELEEREMVSVGLYDAMGHTLMQRDLPNTLNQTYTVDISNQAQGIYLVKVVGQSFSYVRRIMKGD